MLPGSLLSYRRRGGVAVPDYLGPRDYPWLRSLIDEYRRFEGRTFRDLSRRLAEPLSPDGPRRRKARASAVLDRLCRERSRPPVKARAIREALFAAAASRPGAARQLVTRDVARALGIDASELERSLFADISSERLVGRPARALDPAQLALETNTALAKGVISRAVEVSVELAGNAGPVIRLAHLKGLICQVERAGSRQLDALVTISGPLALFRKTTVYGRALAALLPGLAWCDRFRLVARCRLDDRVIPVEIRSGDPLAPANEPRRLESELEERFLRDFARLAPDWKVLREPEPLDTPAGLIVFDFALEHRRDGRRFILEIVGFWTRDYLERKLAAVRAAGLDNLIVCVDAARNCDGLELPEACQVIQYRRRIDPVAIVALLERLDVDSPAS